MAPRRRARKVGLKRMDAAIDSMHPLGFPKELVKTTVKALLNAYGGDEGWVFIEEASYKLLIETILEEQEKCMLKDQSSQDEARGGDDAEPSAAGFSSGVPEPTCSNLEVVDTASQTNKSAAGPSTGIPEPTCSNLEVVHTASQPNETEGEDRLPPAKGEGRGWEDITLDESSSLKQMDIVLGNNDGNSGGGLYLGNTILQSPPHVIHSPPPVGSLPTWRRKPCHGWISSDDEEDLVQSTPAAVLSSQLEKLWGKMDTQRKRKTRWDLKPGDM